MVVSSGTIRNRVVGEGVMQGLFQKITQRVACWAAQQWWRLQTSSTYYTSIAMMAERYGYKSLSSAELKVFSQNGEDGVLAEIFHRIGTTNKFFVEFGVEDGLECNTRFLMEVLGWSGVYFEPSAKSFSRLASRLVNRQDVLAVSAMVTPGNICELFRRADVPAEPDLVSIDIDGQDYWVWARLEGYRPRVVVIEFNASLPMGSHLVEKRISDEEESPNVGASFDALRALGDQKGYTLVHADLAGVNLFFVRKDLAEPFEIALARGPNYRLMGLGRPAYDLGDLTDVSV